MAPPPMDMPGGQMMPPPCGGPPMFQQPPPGGDFQSPPAFGGDWQQQQMQPMPGAGGFGGDAFGNPMMPQQDMSSASGIAQLVQMTSQRSSAFQSIWANFCAQNGVDGSSDPAAYDNAFHIKLLESLAEQALAAGVPVLTPENSSGPGSHLAKRQRDGGCMGGGPPPMGGAPGGMPMMVSSGDPRKDTLVAQIKNFQRAGIQQKELWSLYADTYLQGLRDPSRHDANTLEEFCVNHGVPPVDAATVAMMTGGGGGGGAPGGMPPPGGMPGGGGFGPPLGQYGY